MERILHTYFLRAQLSVSTRAAGPYDVVPFQKFKYTVVIDCQTSPWLLLLATSMTFCVSHRGMSVFRIGWMILPYGIENADTGTSTTMHIHPNCTQSSVAAIGLFLKNDTPSSSPSIHSFIPSQPALGHCASLPSAFRRRDEFFVCWPPLVQNHTFFLSSSSSSSVVSFLLWHLLVAQRPSKQASKQSPFCTSR
jgi:hypothetical protein